MNKVIPLHHQKMFTTINTLVYNVFIMVNIYRQKVFTSDNNNYSNVIWKVYLNDMMLTFPEFQ